MLSDVALVIPTYNRPEFVRRVLSYHARSEGLQIIFGDGSDPPHLAESKKIIESFSGASLEIIHYTPTLPSFVRSGLEGAYGYVERQVNAAKLSARRYINICADDDFVSREFLIDAAEFLDANPDYSAVTGYVFSFRSDQPSAAGRIVDIAMPPLRSTARSEPHAANRIGNYEFDTSTCLEFAFFRHDVFDAIGKALLEVAERAQDPVDTTSTEFTTFTLLYLYDLIPDHVALALGKVHWLPRLQLGRHFHGMNWGGQVANLADSFVASHWSTLANIYLDAVVDALVQSEGLDRGTARRIAEAGLALRSGQRLVTAGQRRLEKIGVTPEAAAPIGIRRWLRAVPGARALVHTAIERLYNGRPVRVQDLPADVKSMLDFVDRYH